MDFRGIFELLKNTIRIDLVLFFLIAMIPSWPGAEANGETFVGKAVNEKGILEYIEYHTVTYENGNVIGSQTIYYDANNNGPNTKTVQKWQWIGFGSIGSKAPKMILKKHILRKKRIK
jgi:hypothetical protein